MPKDPLSDAHVLIPAPLAADLPGLHDTEGIDDPLARIKLFTPDSFWTWYIVEYDPEQRLCYGLAAGPEAERGYFSLAELQALRGTLGLKVERDLYFEPKPLSECE